MSYMIPLINFKKPRKGEIPIYAAISRVHKHSERRNISKAGM